MNREELIIWLYLLVEVAYKAVTGGAKIRQCGRSPGLTDIEVITIEIFGEMTGHHDGAVTAQPGSRIERPHRVWRMA
jgi:hypothetical protein